MNHAEFQNGMTKLISVFGEKAYPPPRVELFFREFRGLPAYRWLAVVEALVGNERLPPMLGEIRAEIARGRESEVARQKTEHRNDAKEFWSRTYSDEDISLMATSIRRRVTGTLDDDAWAAFNRMLRTTGKN